MNIFSRLFYNFWNNLFSEYIWRDSYNFKQVGIIVGLHSVFQLIQRQIILHCVIYKQNVPTNK